MQDKPLTHKSLVRRLSVWLRNTRHHPCHVVASDLHTANTETPDVIGWHGRGSSVLIECKASRADFRSDSSKSFRRDPCSGMGDRRYYAAPKGLLRPDEIPEGWGLLEFDGRSVTVSVPAAVQQADKRSEVAVLASVLRRLEISTAVFIRQDAVIYDDNPSSSGG
jgi:hypothetical protein